MTGESEREKRRVRMPSKNLDPARWDELPACPSAHTAHTHTAAITPTHLPPTLITLSLSLSLSQGPPSGPPAAPTG